MKIAFKPAFSAIIPGKMTRSQHEIVVPFTLTGKDIPRFSQISTGTGNQVILKVRTAEPIGLRYQTGEKGNWNWPIGANKKDVDAVQLLSKFIASLPKGTPGRKKFNLGIQTVRRIPQVSQYKVLLNA